MEDILVEKPIGTAALERRHATSKRPRRFRVRLRCEQRGKEESSPRAREDNIRRAKLARVVLSGA